VVAAPESRPAHAIRLAIGRTPRARERERQQFEDAWTENSRIIFRRVIPESVAARNLCGMILT